MLVTILPSLEHITYVAENSGDPEKDSNNPDGFEPIQDDDVHRFHGDFQHFDVPSGLNGTTEREWIDHGEHEYPGMMDDYVAMRGREEYYYHYGRRHRIHAAYMDDYFGGTGCDMYRIMCSLQSFLQL